jgi:hypothetical protein
MILVSSMHKEETTIGLLYKECYGTQEARRHAIMIISEILIVVI